ncbi:MAG: PilZ domain-containing protein [Myxococcota bacterium]
MGKDPSGDSAGSGRKKLRLRVRYWDHEAEAIGFTAEVSPHGAFIECRKTRPVGTRLHLEVATDKGTFHAECEVTRVRRVPASAAAVVMGGMDVRIISWSEGAGIGGQEGAGGPGDIRIQLVEPDKLASRFESELSSGGMFLRLDPPPENGSELLLALVLPPPHGTFEVKARVVHVSESPVGVGVQFRDAEAVRKRLAAIIASGKDAPETRLETDELIAIGTRFRLQIVSRGQPIAAECIVARLELLGPEPEGGILTMLGETSEPKPQPPADERPLLEASALAPPPPAEQPAPREAIALPPPSPVPAAEPTPAPATAPGPEREPSSEQGPAEDREPAAAAIVLPSSPADPGAAPAIPLAGSPNLMTTVMPNVTPTSVGDASGAISMSVPAPPPSTERAPAPGPSETVLETVSETVLETVLETVSEPVLETVSEPVLETVLETVEAAEPDKARVAEAVIEFISDGRHEESRTPMIPTTSTSSDTTTDAACAGGLILDLRDLETFRRVFKTDIARGGIFLSTSVPARLQDQVTVQLLIPEPHSYLNVEGLVVHCVEEPPGLGVQLIDGAGVVRELARMYGDVILGEPDAAGED